MMNAVKPKKRCVIYTRTSSDDNLDQEFNSLDAQQEAGEHHIKAQAHDGWTLMPTQYSDGGYSASSMDRPALDRLIQDIEKGDIDVVVVYKIDRLSRTMRDFMRLMELFEKYNVAFVSVTQHFNTDTVMGRLILNILQSFAQFELEMTTERILDKIAASKRKGMWMGGPPPLGYDVNNQKLEINPEEAETVRYIFNRFVELQSTTLLVKDLAAKGLRSKTWTSQRQIHHAGGPFTKTNLYKILKSPLYIGKIRHKEKTYDGEHKGIVEPKIFEAVNTLITERVPNFPRIPCTETPYLLQGIIFDPDGKAMTPGAAKKKDKRYRYYVSTQATKKSYDDCPLKTISAPLLEEVIVDQMRRLLSRPEWAVRIMKLVTSATGKKDITEQEIHAALQDFDKLWEELFPIEQRRIVHLLINRIDVYTTMIRITFRPFGMIGLVHELMPDAKNATLTPDAPMVMELPILLKKKGGRKYIVTPDGQDLVTSKAPRYANSMIRAIVRGYEFLEKLDSNSRTTIENLAETEKVDHAYIAKTIRITQLAPDIIEAILNGRQPKGLSLTQLFKPFPDDWALQRRKFGFGGEI